MWYYRAFLQCHDGYVGPYKKGARKNTNLLRHCVDICIQNYHCSCTTEWNNEHKHVVKILHGYNYNSPEASIKGQNHMKLYIPIRDIYLLTLEATFIYAYFSVMFLMGGVV